jgi:hypothetical protein
MTAAQVLDSGVFGPVDILWTVDTTAGAAVQGNEAAQPDKASGGARPEPAAQSWLPGRRAITVWFAIFTVYAGAEIFTRHADGSCWSQGTGWPRWPPPSLGRSSRRLSG